MSYYLRLIGQFFRLSFQGLAAYRMNFWIGLIYSLMNFGTGVLGIVVLFSQIESVQGWTFAGTLALLGVYLTASALRELFIGPSLEALAGMEGEVWSGTLDFTLLRPVDTQFLASFRHWHPFALLDLVLGLGVLVAAITQLDQPLTLARFASFSLAMLGGVGVLYAILLLFTSLVFWSPGVLFTWIFDGIFQMGRYPLGLYPGWVRMVLTWIVPIGIITTIPAEALTGVRAPSALLGSLALAVVLILASSAFFRFALRRYASASS
jgi:ABC-2 type transport system permease protein